MIIDKSTVDHQAVNILNLLMAYNIEIDDIRLDFFLPINLINQIDNHSIDSFIALISPLHKLEYFPSSILLKIYLICLAIKRDISIIHEFLDHFTPVTPSLPNKYYATLYSNSSDDPVLLSLFFKLSVCFDHKLSVLTHLNAFKAFIVSSSLSTPITTRWIEVHSRYISYWRIVNRHECKYYRAMMLSLLSGSLSYSESSAIDFINFGDNQLILEKHNAFGILINLAVLDSNNALLARLYDQASQINGTFKVFFSQLHEKMEGQYTSES